MSVRPLRTAAAAVAIVVGLTMANAQQPRAPYQLEPKGVTGGSIFGAFEGWGPHKDGTNVFMLGYWNRNTDGPVDIPIGPNNRIEPGGPDFGQPTHFEIFRQHGVFGIPVPKDFGTKKLTWTLTVHGQTTSISFWTNPPYWLDFFKHAASGNEPPVIKFAESGPTLTGPPLGIAQTLTASVGQPLALRLWASDVPSAVDRGELDPASRPRLTGRVTDPIAIVGGEVFGGPPSGRNVAATAPPRPIGPVSDITVTWRMHRAPALVKFEPERISLRTGKDPKKWVEAASTATFSAPGDYILRAQVNDLSGDGGGGDLCCWTTALIRVNVK